VISEQGNPSGREPQEPDWAAIRRRVDEQHAADIEAYYRRPIDAAEIEELVDAGYKLPSVHGKWERPPVERGPLSEWQVRTDADVACLTCGCGPGDHQGWCWRGAEEHDVYVAERVAEAKAWEPWVKLPKLSTDERAEINRIFDGLLQRRETRHSFSVVSGPQRFAHTGKRGANRERAYGIAVLDAECWRVARTPAGNRNNTLASAAFKVGRGAVGPGYLERGEAFSNLLGAALTSGLPERESRPVIRTGLSAGAQKPRPLRPVDERPAS
jgi:hypothetical protein